MLLSPAGAPKIGSAVFASCALVLFTVSATMHRGGWSPRVELLLTRMDHASIFLLIAGSYTPFSLLLLTGSDRVVLLAIAWSGAALGIAFRLFVPGAPRWVYTPIYIALGWAAVFFAGDFAQYHVTSVVVLLALGGLLYTVGGVVYGLRRPEPGPAVVRLPRGVPHLHGGGLRRALRGRLDRDLLAALTRPVGADQRAEPLVGLVRGHRCAAAGDGARHHLRL